MTKKFNLSVAVTTNADISGEKVAELLRRLIDVGLADAKATFESGEGDLELAELATDLNIGAPVLAPQETSVKVKYWDCYQYSENETVNTHQFDIADHRETNGQAYMTVGALEGDIHRDMLSVTMEVNTNPLNGIDHVPCAHVHFDDDALAVSLFKIGDKILVRPECDVAISRLKGVRDELYWIE